MSYVRVVCGDQSLEVFVIIETRAQEVRGRACYLACSMGTLGNWIMTLGPLVRAQCHCDLCYVKWFDLSYDYLSNFRGLISLGWKHLILLIQKSYASLFLCHALDLIYITLKYHFTMFNILIEMT